MNAEALELWAPALATIGAFACLAVLPSRDQAAWDARLCRAAASALGIALVGRYAVWRIGALPHDQNLFQDAWAYLFLGTELLNLLSNCLVFFFMSRTLDRSREADAVGRSPLRFAPTDVFIATYNEPASVIERTIVGALDIDHPDL